MFRLIDTGQLKDRRLERELIEDVFRSAKALGTPITRPYVGETTEPRASYIAEAEKARLDQLSVQCRAVEAMLARDPRRARELFEEISLSIPVIVGCSELLIPDVSIYDRLLARASRSAGTGKLRSGMPPSAAP